MGLFFKITSESQGAKTPEKALINNKVIDYILDSLNDFYWQDEISLKLRNKNAQFSHITIGAILRLFLLKNIEAGKLKSFSRYIQKDDKLIIDQMIVADEYEALSEDETRAKMCDEVYLYFSEVILKNKAKFQDFDALSFIPLLKDRFDEIKNEKITNDRTRS